MINRNGPGKFGHQPQKQMGLFDPAESIVLDPGPTLKAAMRKSEKAAIKNYSLSRDNIIDAINEMAEQANITCNGNAKRVTMNIYVKWLSASDKHYIPIRLLHIFCRAVKSTEPIEVYTTFFQRVCLIDKEDLKKLQWAELEITKRKITKQSKQLAAQVGL